jgi:hypothetical protein
MGFDEDSGAFKSLFSSFLLLLESIVEVLASSCIFIGDCLSLFPFSFHFSVLFSFCSSKNSMNIYIQALYARLTRQNQIYWENVSNLVEGN